MVFVGLHPSHWLVWLVDLVEFKDLPQLQSIRLDSIAFRYVHSVVFESDRKDWMMIQICLNYNPFNLVDWLYLVMKVMVERRLAMNLTTIRTHWQWKVRLNELMNEQIFLHWQNSKENGATSMLSVQWFWRVWIWWLINVDIAQLSSDGIRFGHDCFKYTYSLQSLSTHSSISSPFDASTLESAIRRESNFI